MRRGRSRSRSRRARVGGVNSVLNRVEIMHGVNLDQLGRRDRGHYGTFTYDELERYVSGVADDLGLEARFFQSNHEGEFVEHLHRLEGLVDGVVLNPGAWTHYSYAIRDALELTGLPAVEVHLSDVDSREEWRRKSVIVDLCIGRIAGKGHEGYRDALQVLQMKLSS
jgi:3-dehydroquinate dehydratase II